MQTAKEKSKVYSMVDGLTYQLIVDLKNI